MSESKRPKVELVHSISEWEMPMQSLYDFKEWVLEEGMAPSKALRKVLVKYKCNDKTSATIQLLRKTYPDIDISSGGFRFYIIDSHYPDSDPNDFSDQDFDEGIARILAIPTLGW